MLFIVIAKCAIVNNDVNLMNIRYIHVESVHTEKYVRTRYRQWMHIATIN